LIIEPFGGGDARQTSLLVGLFAACHSECFCRYWHFPGDKNEWLARCAFDAAQNRTELEAAAAVRSPEARGVLAVEGEIAIGWAKVAPREAVPKLYDQRYYRGLPVLQGPAAGTYAIGCLLVHPDHRRKRVAHALVRGAVDVAKQSGARVLEAFPRVAEEPVADEELFMGPSSAFVDAGFLRAHDASPYPVLRLVLD
jgi:GNAT superfamily N-acetyltransferase